MLPYEDVIFCIGFDLPESGSSLVSVRLKLRKRYSSKDDQQNYTIYLQSGRHNIISYETWEPLSLKTNSKNTAKSTEEIRTLKYC